MSLVDDLLSTTEIMGVSVERVVTYQEAYTLLLRSLLEITQLNHRIAVLEHKVIN